MAKNITDIALMDEGWDLVCGKSAAMTSRCCSAGVLVLRLANGVFVLCLLLCLCVMCCGAFVPPAARAVSRRTAQSVSGAKKRGRKRRARLRPLTLPRFATKHALLHNRRYWRAHALLFWIISISDINLAATCACAATAGSCGRCGTFWSPPTARASLNIY